jgi:sulfate adenylyltransferase
MKSLIAPHGGRLIDLYLNPGRVEAEKGDTRHYPTWDLTPRQLCDIELLMDGSFSPLEGFMDQSDYDRVLDEMRLANGLLWPIPVVLDVTESFAGSISTGSPIALRDPEGVLIAVMDVESIWMPDRLREAERTFGTKDPSHPGVLRLLHQTGPVYLGGSIRGMETPVHYDFRRHRRPPKEVRDIFTKRGWTRVIAFHTADPMHRADADLAFRAAREAEANLFLHPVTGPVSPGDAGYYARIRGYEHAARKQPEQTTMLSLLPFATREAGPREALLHAIVRQNYGCTQFIVVPHHAEPGSDSAGGSNDGYAAQRLFRQYEEDLAIEMVPARTMVYAHGRAEYVPDTDVRPGESVATISRAELSRRLLAGLKIEDWHAFPEVIEELKKASPPRHRQGFTVFFTGLSGAGKSTIANALLVRLMEHGGRRVTLLDGDLVRKRLSSELGFSREHRDLNILRIGYVASEITKNGGVAICAPIAPYAATRHAVRQMIEPEGGFIEVHVATPIDICESRDRKGLYAKARAGMIKGFTGVDDPYEVPADPELCINTAECSPEEAAQKIILKLENMGFILSA